MGRGVESRSTLPSALGFCEEGLINSGPLGEERELGSVLSRGLTRLSDGGNTGNEEQENSSESRHLQQFQACSSKGSTVCKADPENPIS